MMKKKSIKNNQLLVFERLRTRVSPENWIKVTLEDIGEIVSGGTPSTKDPENFGGNISWLTPADLSDFHEKYISHGKRNLSEKGLRNSSAKLMPAGTILFTSRAPIGYVAIARNEISTNQGFKNLIPSSYVFNEYIYYYLKASKKLAENYASGTTFLEISAKSFAKLPIPLPPLNEQKRIVAKIEELFSKLDAGVESLKKAEAQLRRYRQSVLKAAFEGKLTEKWRERHGENFGYEFVKRLEFQKHTNTANYKQFLQTKIPRNWQVLPLKSLVKSFQNGLSKRKSYSGDSTVVIRLADIEELRISLTNTRSIKLSDKEIEKYSLSPEDILIIRVNGSKDLVGRFIYADLPHDEKIAFCDHFIRCTVRKEMVRVKYLIYFAESNIFRKQMLKNMVSTAGQNTINQSRLSNMFVLLPSIPEQQKIVEEIERRFSIIDSLEKTIDKSLKEAERLRQAILKKAFEGRLAPQDPNDEPAWKLLERIKEEKKRLEAEKKNKKKRTKKGRC